MTKICLAGDFFIGGDLIKWQAEDAIKVKSFNESDIRIVNLEQSILDRGTPSDKGTLYTNPETLEHLKKIEVNYVNLANNHIHDSGELGIEDTYTHLKNINITPFGAGKNRTVSKQAAKVTDEIVLLGYCEFGKKYLKTIMVSSDTSPRVNPLRLKNILEDLNNLKESQKAILYFHWGKEHVFLPPYDDIELAKTLLAHPKVLTIVGMHAHRPQGYIEAKGKRAYMCLGNFLFPNFFIQPPTQLYYPQTPPTTYDVTRQYHSVYKLTYKKWRWINRISIIVLYNNKTKQISHSFTYQNDKPPTIHEFSGIKWYTVNFIVWSLSQVYKLPKPIYISIERVLSIITYRIWNTQIIIKRLRQLGPTTFFCKSLNFLLKKYHL